MAGKADTQQFQEILDALGNGTLTPGRAVTAASELSYQAAITEGGLDNISPEEVQAIISKVNASNFWAPAGEPHPETGVQFEMNENFDV